MDHKTGTAYTAGVLETPSVIYTPQGRSALLAAPSHTQLVIYPNHFLSHLWFSAQLKVELPAQPQDHGAEQGQRTWVREKPQGSREGAALGTVVRPQKHFLGNVSALGKALLLPS